MTQYLVEFKVGSTWVQTTPFGGGAEDKATAYATEKTLHDAGIKARIVVLRTERLFLGEA